MVFSVCQTWTSPYLWTTAAETGLHDTHEPTVSANSVSAPVRVFGIRHSIVFDPPNAQLQPRRLMIPPAAVGCKLMLASSLNWQPPIPSHESHTAAKVSPPTDLHD
jgi:hypothetical protein